MDATAWGAIGGGLTALSEGLTAMELRRLAKEKEKQDRERQKQQDALEKAQLAAQSSAKLRSENFKRVGNKDDLATKRRILNDIAMKRKNEEVTDPITGDVYLRGEGESPIDIAQSAKQRDLELKAQLASQAAETKAAIEQIRQDNLNRRFEGTSGNVQTQEAGRNRRWDTASGSVQVQQAGANTRAAMSQAGQDRRQQTGQTGAAAKPPTESQAKDAKYYDMMEKAVPVLDRLADKVRGDRISLAIRSPEMISNRFLTPEEQEYLRAARDFATGVYRPETGASAKPSEIQDVFNRYLTVGGDAPAIRQIKSSAREGKLVTQRNAALPALKYYQAQQSILNAPQGSGKAIDALKTLGVP